MCIWQGVLGWGWVIDTHVGSVGAAVFIFTEVNAILHVHLVFVSSWVRQSVLLIESGPRSLVPNEMGSYKGSNSSTYFELDLQGCVIQ